MDNFSGSDTCLQGKKVKLNKVNGMYGVHTNNLYMQDINTSSLCFISKTKVLDNLLDSSSEPPFGRSLALLRREQSNYTETLFIVIVVLKLLYGKSTSKAALRKCPGTQCLHGKSENSHVCLFLPSEVTVLIAENP